MILVLTARGYCEAVKESKFVDDWRGLFVVIGPHIIDEVDELDESVGKEYKNITIQQDSATLV